MRYATNVMQQEIISTGTKGAMMLSQWRDVLQKNVCRMYAKIVYPLDFDPCSCM